MPSRPSPSRVAKRGSGRAAPSRAVMPWHDSDDIPVPEFDDVPTFPWDPWGDGATGYRRAA